MLVLGLAVGLWALGWVFRVPVRQRLVVLAALWAAALAVTLALPEGAGLRRAVGGSWQGWLVLGGAGALVAAYGAVLRRARARARPVPAKSPQGPFSDAEIARYSRHILLHDIGGPGQARLKAARVLVVGAGGLGAPALMYLAAAGVGRLGFIDDDTVDPSNLQRQIIHGEDRIGQPKVASAATTLAALNPHVTLAPDHRRLTPEIAAALFADYDLILDGSDNFDTRYLVNRVAAAQGKPLIAAALTQWEGQLSLYDPARGHACYECVFPDRPAPGMVPACAEAGVAGPLPGVVGAMMAMEAVKHLTGAGEGLAGRLMLYDALSAEVRVIRTRRRAGCAACGGAG